MLKNETGHPVQHPAPPVLRRAGAQGLTDTGFNDVVIFLFIAES